MTQRAVLNGRFLSQTMTGVQRYAREATRALDALLDEQAALVRRWKFEVVAPPDAELDLELRHIPVRRTGGRLRGHVWEQAALPRELGARDVLVNYANTGPLRVARQLVLMHDAAVWAVPDTFSRAFRWGYRLLLPALGRRAWRVGTVSEFSRRELIERVGIAPGKLVVIPAGAEHALRTAPAGAARLALPESPFVLAVGSEVPHKQFAIIEAAIARPECVGVALVVVGGASGRSHAAPRGTPVGPGVRLGRVSDGELRALYEHALCLVFPSSYEGFGLPALEAMACGCPVIVSRAGALPEVCGDAALYCAVGDSAGLARELGQLAADDELRAEMIARGRARAAAFTWRRTAERLVAVLDQLPPGRADAA